MARNYDRRCLISLSGSSSMSIPGGGPDDLRVEFAIGASTMQTPNECRARVTNPNAQTIAAFKGKEFQTVEIQAGYLGNMGLVYRGDIRQSLYAHEENVVDSYIDIFAATAGNAYQQANVGKTLAAGWKPQDKLNVALDAMKPYGVTGLGVVNVDLSTPQYPRGRPFIGMARDLIREVAYSAGASWFMDHDGKVNLINHNNPVQTGSVVVLNSDTGMQGYAQQSENGVIVRCLLNPSIRAGITAVQINEDSINRGQRDNSLSGGFGTVGDRNQGLDTAGKISADGTYRVVFMETECDTHSPSSWTQTLTCIAIGGALNTAQAQSYTGPPLTLNSL